MDIKKATEIIKKDYDIYKKNFEAEKGKGKGAKTQPYNHYNHFIKFVQSHKCNDDDSLESFFLSILSEDFVKPENMPSSWKSFQAVSLAFKSMNTCLDIPQIKDYILSVISEDQYNAIQAKCSEYYSSFRKQYESIEHDKKSVNLSVNDDASSTTSISVDYEQLVEELNQAILDKNKAILDKNALLEENKQHIKKIEACKILLKHQIDQEKDDFKKTPIEALLELL